MSLQITCPLPVGVPDILDAPCETQMGQIVRLAFTKAQAETFLTEASFATDIEWSTNLALGDTDAKSVQLVPLFNNFVIPEGAAATIGPDTNETLFGELRVVGTTAITATGRFSGLPFDVKAQLEAYISEGATYGSLGVILIDEFGQCWGKLDGTVVKGIPISSFFIGDPGTEGYNTLTYTPFQFNFKAGWANDVIKATPDFDLITKTNAP